MPRARGAGLALIGLVTNKLRFSCRCAHVHGTYSTCIRLARLNRNYGVRRITLSAVFVVSFRCAELEMSLPPIKAHQQVPLPLLRRPRPPPKRVSEDQLNSTATSISRNITKSVAEDLLDSELVQEKLKSTSTPVYHLPRHHPTPSSPHRHPFTPHTIIQHTSPQHQSHSPINEDRDEAFSPRDLTSAESLKNDNIIIHSLFPRGPEFFPQRKMRLKKHKSTPRNWKKEEEAGDLGFRTFAPPEQGGPRFSELDPEEAALYEPPPTKLRGNFISRQNYLKLTGWFATHVPHQEALNTLDITGRLAVFTKLKITC